MKSTSILFLFVMLSASQAFSQKYFNNVALLNVHGRNIINFSLPKEVNVVYYRVEAANDTAEFDIIGRVASTGNSMLPKSYNYELYATSYKYFRIGMVAMDGSLHYSELINMPKTIYINAPIFKGDKKDTNHVMANNKLLK